MNAVLEPFALSWALRSTCLLAVSFLLIAFLKNASASRRHFALFLTFLALLLLPVFSAVLPVWQLALLPPAVERTEVIETAVPKSLPVPATLVVDRAMPAVPAPPRPPAIPLPPALQETEIAPTPSPALPLALLALLVYSAVLALLLAREGVGALWLSRLGAQSRMVSEERMSGIFQNVLHILQPRQTVRLFTHPTVSVPMTWGTLMPVVLLPTGAKEWSSERLQAVLLHEVAHIYRNDALTQSIVRFICLLYWWHPGVWWLGRMLAAEAERACDDLVLAAGIGGADYAHHLVAVVREANTAHLTYPAIAIGRPNALKTRIQAILERTRDRQRVSRRGMVLGGLIAFLLLLPSAILHLRSAVTEQQAPPTEKAVDATVLKQSDYEPIGLIVAKNGVAVLPNGVRVSHLATTLRLWSGQYQWNSSGEFIPVEQTPILAPGLLAQRKGAQPHSFKFLISNVPTKTMAYRFTSNQPNMSLSDGASGIYQQDKPVGRVITNCLATINPMIANLSLDLEIALGDGTQIASSPLPGFSGQQTGYDLNVMYGKSAGTHFSSEKAKRALSVKIHLPEEMIKAQAAYRIVAVDLNGKEHLPTITTTEGKTTEFLIFPELQNGQAREIRLYRTPYERVRFPNISPSMAFKNDDSATFRPSAGTALLPDGTRLVLSRKNEGKTAKFAFQFPNRDDLGQEDIAYRLEGSDNPNNKFPRTAAYTSYQKSKVEASYELPLLRKWGKLTMQTWIASRNWQTVEEYHPADLQTPQARQQKGIFEDSQGYAVGLTERFYGKPVRVQEVAPDGAVLSFDQFIWGEKGETGIIPLGRRTSENTIRIQTAPLYYVPFPVSE